jgi:hypothetical protein
VSEANSIETRIGWWECVGGALAHVESLSTFTLHFVGTVYAQNIERHATWSHGGIILGRSDLQFNLAKYIGPEDPRTPVIEIHEMRPEPEQPEPVHKYHRRITHTLERGAIIQTGDRVTITVDVYDVLRAFDVRCPATQHAVKKLLCAGIRGHKDKRQDLAEARESIGRAIELEVSDGPNIP